MDTFLRLIRRLWRRFLASFGPARSLAEGSIDFDHDGISSVDIRRLRKGDIITVRTENSLYNVQVVDPLKLLVEVWGGTQFFITRKSARFSGSVPDAGASALFSGKIVRGMQLEFGIAPPVEIGIDQVGTKVTLTSATLGISVNGMIPVTVEQKLRH